MGFLERLNRILVSCLLSLVFLQIALLFFLKSLQDEAQYRLVKNTTKAAIACGEKQFSEENYWSVANESVLDRSECTLENCQKSFMSWQRTEQDKELHLISVQAPPPFNMESLDQAGIVKVRIRKSEKKQIITLVNRSPLQWDFVFDKGATVEKVIVATPSTVWLQGLSPTTPIEYLPKDKMCSYPFAWEDAFNPENEFRVLAGALRTITGLSLNTFQGAQSGREFWVPQKLAQQRGLASVQPQTIPAPVGPQSIQWQRTEGHMIAEKFTLSSGATVMLPAKTTSALEAEGEHYIIVGRRLQQWTKSGDKFAAVDVPLTLPNVNDVTALAYDPERKGIVLYNDYRSGEFYLYKPAEQQWMALATSFKHNLVSLYYDLQAHKLMALVSRGDFFTGLVTMDADGKEEGVQELKTKLPYDRKRWRLKLEKNNAQWQVTVFSPYALKGENWALQ